MALLLSCKSMRMASSSAAAARRVLPAVGSRFMQLVPQQQAPCRQISAHVQMANMGVPQAEGVPMYADPQATAGVPAMSSTVFADFSVYKTKGAMSVKPIKPTWAATSNGGWKMERNGAMLFELANPLGGAERRYNWDQKVVIGLQANELSTILVDPNSEHKFYHDTFKGQTGRQGTLVKTLRWSRAPDGANYFINASVNDKANGINNTVNVSLSDAEFYTFKRLVDYSIPYMLGWDTLFNTST